MIIMEETCLEHGLHIALQYNHLFKEAIYIYILHTAILIHPISPREPLFGPGPTSTAVPCNCTVLNSAFKRPRVEAFPTAVELQMPWKSLKDSIMQPSSHSWCVFKIMSNCMCQDVRYLISIIYVPGIRISYYILLYHLIISLFQNDLIHS